MVLKLGAPNCGAAIAAAAAACCCCGGCGIMTLGVVGRSGLPAPGTKVFALGLNVNSFAFGFSVDVLAREEAEEVDVEAAEGEAADDSDLSPADEL